MKKLKIASVGAWHSLSSKFARIVSEYPECELVCVWDSEEARGRRLAEERGCRFEADYQALLADPEIDGLIFTCEIARHAKLIVPAAKAGKHIFCEKPMALSKEDAYAIRDAVREGQVHFLVSDPIIHASVAAAKHLVESGTIGDVINAYFRLVNYRAIDGSLKPDYPPYNREEAGGGIMADLGGHMVHAVQYFMGRPESVSSICNAYTAEGKAGGCEENVSALFRYADGRIAVGETSWIAPDNQMLFCIYGTKGTVMANYKECRYCLHELDWVEIAPEHFPEEGVYPLRLWVDMLCGRVSENQLGILDSTCRCVSLDQAVELAEMTDAIYRSKSSGVLL